MNSFTQYKPYWTFRTNAIYFPFEARKETHEQHKTKIDIDEFRSGTTNITLLLSEVDKKCFWTRRQNANKF